jgi:formate dehydrogenase iron-sulfur subunit
MSLSRRKFLGWIGAAGMTAAAGRKASAATTHHFEGHPDSMAVLHDTTLCIGCRQCEGACNAVNDLPAPEVPFTDLSACSTTAGAPHPRPTPWSIRRQAAEAALFS